MAPCNLQHLCEETGAVFAVWWTYENGSLRIAEHFNPVSRVEQVRAATMKDDLYTTESYDFVFQPDEGLVGSVFKSQQHAFYPDITALSNDVFLRKEVAERYGIKSVAFAAFEDGVLEIGSIDIWTSFTPYTLDELVRSAM